MNLHKTPISPTKVTTRIKVNEESKKKARIIEKKIEKYGKKTPQNKPINQKTQTKTPTKKGGNRICICLSKENNVKKLVIEDIPQFMIMGWREE